MLTLYYLSNCPFCTKVLDHLKKMNKTVAMKDIDLPGIREELREIGGKSQVPCLVIDGNAMYESAAIMQWMSNHPTHLEG